MYFFRQTKITSFRHGFVGISPNTKRSLHIMYFSSIAIRELDCDVLLIVAVATGRGLMVSVVDHMSCG